MSWQDAIKRRLGMNHKSAATRGTSRIEEDDPRWDAKTMGNKQGSNPMRINPNAQIDTSQIIDNRPSTKGQVAAQERQRKIDYMKNSGTGPPSATLPDKQWDGKTIMRRMSRR